eukprot:sb/3471391/
MDVSGYVVKQTKSGEPVVILQLKGDSITVERYVDGEKLEGLLEETSPFLKGTSLDELWGKILSSDSEFSWSCTEQTLIFSEEIEKDSSSITWAEFTLMPCQEFNLSSATALINRMLIENSENSTALREAEDTLNECQKAKADLEAVLSDRVAECNNIQRDLLGRCAELLNAKKRKIVALQKGTL